MKRKIAALISFYSVVVYLARQAEWRGKNFRVVMEHSKRKPQSSVYEWMISLQASDEDQPQRYITTTLAPSLWRLMDVVVGGEEGEGERR